LEAKGGTFFKSKFYIFFFRSLSLSLSFFVKFILI